MANIGTLTAHIGIDNMGLNRGLTQAQGRFSQFSGGAVKSIAKIGSAFAALGLAVGGLAVFRSITKTGIDFEQTMTTVAGVMRATADESKRLTAAARKMGETTEWSASEAGGALQFLGMAGFEANKAISALPGTLDLATAGQIGLGRAADIATNALTAMGLEVGELERVNDVFVGTITRSNTNMEMMAESFKYAAPVARAYGYTVEELSGLIGMLGNAGIQGCYDNKTEVLTKRGWVHWSEVTQADKFATVNPETNHIEYQEPRRLIRYHHKGKMYLVTNQSVNLCVTPDHRMWVKPRGKKAFEFVMAENLREREVRYQAGGLQWEGNDEAIHRLDGFSQGRGTWTKGIPSISIDAKVWASFLGWYIAEGSCDCRGGNYRVRITQTKDRVRHKMRAQLARLPWKVHENKDGFEITSQQLWKEVVPLGKQPERYIPAYAKDWSPRLLKALLDSLVEGDGDCNGAYYTSSPRLRDDVSEVALKLGHAVTVVQHGKAGDISNFDKEGRAIRANYDQWKVNIRRKQLYPWYSQHEYKGVHGSRLDGSRSPARSEWIDYDGEVFCAEVPNHLLIVRRNGKVIVSGNSMAGTQLAMAMQKTNKVAKDFGVEGGKFVDVLEQLREKGYSSTEVMTAFGLRAGRAAGVLYEATDATREFQETLGGVQGEAKRLADAMRSTVGASFKELKSVVESLALDVFEVYRDELKAFVVDTTTWIRENKDSIVGFVESVKSFLGGVMEVVSTVATLLGKLGLGFTDFYETLESNAVETANAVAESGEKIRDALGPPSLTPWQEFWAFIKRAAIDVFDVLKFIVRGIGTMFAGLLKFIVADVIGNMILAFWDLSNVIVAALTLDLSGVRKWTQEYLGHMKAMWIEGGETGQSMINALGNAWSDMITSLKTPAWMERIGATWGEAGATGPQQWWENLPKGPGMEMWGPQQFVGPLPAPPPPPTLGGGAILTMPTMPTMPTQTLADWVTEMQSAMQEFKQMEDNRLQWMLTTEQISKQEYLGTLQAKLAGETAFSNEWMNTQAQIGAVEQRISDERKARWIEETRIWSDALDIMLAGYDTFWASLFDKDMTGKERREAIWEDMKNSFIGYTAEMTKRWLKDTAFQVLITKTGERNKTLAVAAGAMSRIAWAIKEGAAAIASAAKSIYSAVAKIFEAHAWIPFAGVAIAAGFVGAMMATMGKFKKFHQGGLVGDEVVGIMKKREYVLDEPTVAAVGVPALDYLNRTHRFPGGEGYSITVGDVTIGSTGTPKDFFLLDEFKDALVDLIKEKLRNRELEM